MVVSVLWSWVWCCAKMVSDNKWTFCSRIFHTTNHDRAIWRVSTPVRWFDHRFINRGGCCWLPMSAIIHRRHRTLTILYFVRFLHFDLLAIVFGGVWGFGRCIVSPLTGRCRFSFPCVCVLYFVLSFIGEWSMGLIHGAANLMNVCFVLRLRCAFWLWLWL